MVGLRDLVIEKRLEEHPWYPEALEQAKVTARGMCQRCKLHVATTAVYDLLYDKVKAGPSEGFHPTLMKITDAVQLSSWLKPVCDKCYKLLASTNP